MLFDYDTSNDESILDLRKILESLRESALSEENTEFDPSGTTNSHDILGSPKPQEPSESATVGSEDSPADTERTDATTAADSDDISEVPARQLDELIPQWQTFSLQEKEAILKEMFPSVRAFDIGYVLEKSGNDCDRAIEQLLNQVFLDVDTDDRGEKTFKRGVDGFSEPSMGLSRRKKGGKRNQHYSSDMLPQTSDTHTGASQARSSRAMASNSIIPSYKPRTPSPEMTRVAAAPVTMTFPSRTSDRLEATRTHAYGQAASAHRAAKSKPLMGGAAAYYGSVAREATAALHEQDAADAESLVSRQSRPGEVDLHGISTQHAVRICKRRVEHWWEHEGREWALGGKVKGEGLIFITGRGQHSQGGKGKLGPAIGSMLVREGWKVEVGSGAIEVIGRARR